MFARRLLLVGLSIAACLGAASNAEGTTPGANGRLAFASGKDGTSELYSVNADGSAERRLTWTAATEQSPTWSPDGGRIAYERHTAGGARIWVMNADGSGQREISPSGGDFDDTDPAWSPDGTQIAFGSTRAGTWNLWVMSVDGSGLRRVSDVSASDPAWSPDGEQLAYVGMNGVGVMNLDGSNAHVVSAPGAFASGPSWSPDGGQLAFSRNNDEGYAGELYVAKADGSGERQLTSDGFQNARPSWSPDGTQIAFQRNAPPFGWNLWAVGSDGGGLRQITSGGNDLVPDWGSSELVPEPSPPEAPTIELYSPIDGADYRPGMDVRAIYGCFSAVSVIVSCQGDVALGEQVDLSEAGTHTFTVRATDFHGRTAVKTVTYHVRDVFPPQIELITPADGASYELGAEVTIDYSCTDLAGTGVFLCNGDRPSGAPLDTTRAGSHTFTVYAFDNAGNFQQVTATYTVIDRRPPVIDISSPADGAVYTLGSTTLAAYSCRSIADAELLTCDGTVANGSAVDTASVGAKTFTVRASDANGSTATLIRTYRVIYAFSGFDAPVSASGYINEAKAGDAIPLKFSLNGYKGLNIVTGTMWQRVSCMDWSGLEGRATGQSKLSYSASTDRYLDLVGTDPDWKGSCRTVELELSDGTRHVVRVRFTR